MKGLESLMRPAIWVGLIGVASKIMSAVCGILLAYQFGAGQATDAYLIAKTVPIGVYLILDSVIYNTFVPLLRRPEKTDATFRTLLVLFFFGACGVAAVVYVGAAELVSLLARGADGATQAHAIQLQHITAWAIIYAVPASCLKAWNACQSRYVAPSLDGFVLSLILLFTLLVVPERMGIMPVTLALPAAFLILLIIQGTLARRILTLRPRVPMTALPGRYLNRVMTPLLLLNGAQQAQVLLVVALASFHGSGALSQVNYSYAIAQIPVGVVDLILFSTLFPFAAQLAAHRQLDALRRTFQSAALGLLVLAVPIACWVVIMRSALVDTLLTRGHFDATDAQTTAALLLGHGLAIPAWVLEALGCRVLFALGQHRYYLGAVAIRLVAFAAIAPLGLAWLGLPGLSLAFAASFVVGAGSVAWMVRRVLPGGPIRRAGLRFGVWLLGGVLVGTAVSTLVIQYALGGVDPFWQIGVSGVILVGILGAGLWSLKGRGYFA